MVTLLEANYEQTKFTILVVETKKIHWSNAIY